MPLQKGDVPSTWADTSLLEQLTSFSPKTNFKMGCINSSNGIENTIISDYIKTD